MSKLLFDEVPIVVSKELSAVIGLSEAVVLQQVHYWVEINRKANRNFHEGRFWVYNSIKDWHENFFDFCSLTTVKRIFSKLESMGLLLSDNFNRDPRDNTKWYTIDNEAVDLLKNRSRNNNAEGVNQPLCHNGIAGEPLDQFEPTKVISSVNEQAQLPTMNQPLCHYGTAQLANMSQPLPEDYVIDYNIDYNTHTFVPERACDTTTEKNNNEITKGVTVQLLPLSTYDPEFEKFWSAYPKKTETQKTFRLWKTQLKEGLTSEDLLNAAQNYAEFCRVKNTEQRFIKHPATFLGRDKPFLEWVKPKGGDTFAGINTAGTRSIVTGNSEQSQPEHKKSKYPMRRFIDGIEYFY